ncbi:glycosyltransferase family protein [Halopseudomonas salina]|uniref:Uncharacterized protein n=1 Tax=Halopseudomonas salina TaxID=1323744 RepID=A0ABQ1PVF0_9GAMM|nr:glycosyltransferase family 4 protein [Halopseudomonas salina]GGD04628.1 hypothetical protein GCM10007418_24620 [Halopseudomonas salina]
MKTQSNLEPTPQLKVCYALAYKAPKYIRTLSIIQALEREEKIHLTVATNSSTNTFRYLETTLKLIIQAFRGRPDIYILGFRGHELYWLLKLIAGNRPIVIDALMSPYASLVEERKLGKAGLIISNIIKIVESTILKSADLIITDTDSHSKYYSETFSISEKKIVTVPVGAIEIDHLTRTPVESSLTILFYGSFLPLHGVSTIVDAIAFIPDIPLHFIFIGGKLEYEKTLKKAFAKRTPTLSYKYIESVPFDQLIDFYIPMADVCLGGPFGGTKQAHRVITGKTSQCLALARTTIIGETNEVKNFKHKENCLITKQNDPKSLAENITWCWDNRDRLEKIGIEGRKMYFTHLSIDVIRAKLTTALFNMNF